MFLSPSLFNLWDLFKVWDFKKYTNEASKELSGWEASCGTPWGDVSGSQASCAGSCLSTPFSFDNPVPKKWVEDYQILALEVSMYSGRLFKAVIIPHSTELRQDQSLTLFLWKSWIIVDILTEASAHYLSENLISAKERQSKPQQKRFLQISVAERKDIKW